MRAHDASDRKAQLRSTAHTWGSHRGMTRKLYKKSVPRIPPNRPSVYRPIFVRRQWRRFMLYLRDKRGHGQQHEVGYREWRGDA
jgi:hypothetical protein